MFEIHTNDHHYTHKAIFLGALILVLGVAMWTNVFAQRAVVMAVPTDFTVTPITTKQSPLQPATTSTGKDGIAGVYSIITGELVTGTNSTITSPVSTGIIASPVSPTNTTGVAQSTGVKSDTVLIYARKIEALIAIKGQDTRMTMLTIMNKFLAKYTPDHPVYATIQRMVDIIKLGEVAHKLEYCTQFDDTYVLELFGLPMRIHSTIKYAQAIKRCEMTFQYPDQSIHSCRFDEAQKQLISQMIKDKQGLNQDSVGLGQNDSSNIFESVLDGYLRDTTCYESQKAVTTIVKAISSSTGLVDTGAAADNNRRQFTKK